MSTSRQFLLAGLIDAAHRAISPVHPGSGVRLCDGLDLTLAGCEVARPLQSAGLPHRLLQK